MAEKTPNFICQYCEKHYYACPACEKNGSWRAVACTPECYKELMVIVPTKEADAIEVAEDINTTILSKEKEAEIIKTKKKK